MFGRPTILKKKWQNNNKQPFSLHAIKGAGSQILVHFRFPYFSGAGLFELWFLAQ